MQINILIFLVYSDQLMCTSDPRVLLLTCPEQETLSLELVTMTPLI